MLRGQKKKKIVQYRDKIRQYVKDEAKEKNKKSR